MARIERVSSPDAAAPGRTSPIASAPSLSELLSAANELVPILRDRARETETQRRVSGETMAEFRAAGFFRLMQPGTFGGYEYGFTALLDLITTLGRGCTSSAWNCGIAVSHQWLIGGFPPQAQRDVWSENRDAVACASYAPTGQAERVEDGQLIHGRWHFVSNVDNSDWAILGVNLPAAERRFPHHRGGDPASGGDRAAPVGHDAAGNDAKVSVACWETILRRAVRAELG